MKRKVQLLKIFICQWQDDVIYSGEWNNQAIGMSAVLLSAGVESLTLKILKTWLDRVVSNLLLLTLFWAGKLDQVISRVSYHT